MKEDLEISYRFGLPRGERDVSINLRFDANTFEMRLPMAPDALPRWTDLTFNQCPNCPLRPETHPACPAAARLAAVVPHFEAVVSYDRLSLEVRTPERRTSAHTTVQQALSSLIGLIMATSGCPRTRFFRVMARYHLPLATEAETTLRALGAFVLREFLRSQAAALDLKDLAELYGEVRTVNKAIARRLGAAGRTDSALNAVVILDVFAMAIPAAIDTGFEDLEPFVRLPGEDPRQG